MIRIIGFGGSMQVGKTTAANVLVKDFGFVKIAFADALKAMLSVLDVPHDYLYGDKKSLPCEQLEGRTGRFAMQTLGTEWGRDLIGPNLWTNYTKRIAQRWIDNGALVVIDDVRFESEANMIYHLGGKVTLVNRAADRVVSHASEECNFYYTDIIENAYDKLHFENAVREMYLKELE